MERIKEYLKGLSIEVNELNSIKVNIKGMLKDDIDIDNLGRELKGIGVEYELIYKGDNLTNFLVTIKNKDKENIEKL